jgi:hypothetical protein
VRLVVTKAVKVQPGDEVIIRAALSSGTSLARLYIWARQKEDTQFSPYVQGLGAEVVSPGGSPQMHKPLSMRLISKKRSDKVSFISDIEGQIVVIQEVDSIRDKTADVKIELVMVNDSSLARFKRRITEWPKTVQL